MCFLTSWQNDLFHLPGFLYFVIINSKPSNDHTKLDKIPKSSVYWPNSEDTAIYNVEKLKWNVQLENFPSSPYSIWK